LLEHKPAARGQGQHEGIGSEVGAREGVQRAETVEEVRRPLEVARLEDPMADPSDPLGASLIHRSIGHPLRRPELELIPIRVNPLDGDALFAFRRSPERIGVRRSVGIEPPEVIVEVFLANVEAVPRQRLARPLARRQFDRLQETAMAAPGGKRLKCVERIWPIAAQGLGAEHLLVERDPPRQVVGSHGVMVDPVNRSRPLILEHLSSSP
jgi:hypothetical protein